MKTLLTKLMVNDLGVDPNEWFETPKSDEPLPVVITDEYAPCDVEYDLENPDESDEIESLKVEEDDWFSDKPEKKEETMHEKMYRIATARYNPFSLGGSENCDSDITCNLGGSEERLEDEFTPENDPYGGY